jgi:hypothetical protein
MQRNHVYVEDDDKGLITVYDDQGKLKPERKFRYASKATQVETRQRAEDVAASLANKLDCLWGCNYGGGPV